jgi:hypothetical protein
VTDPALAVSLPFLFCFVLDDGAGKGIGTDPVQHFDLPTSHVSNGASKFHFRAMGGARGGVPKCTREGRLQKCRWIWLFLLSRAQMM